LAVSDREGLARYVALQQHYNLVEREKYEGELADLVAREGLSSLPYYALASGFLTGKYRPGAKVQSQRAQGASAYLNEKGIKVLAALDEVAAAQNTAVAVIALAWLAAQPTVVAPIASARTTDQLPDLLRVSDVRLSDAELRKLNEASAFKGNNGAGS
jgi:aryl-alcohol dehydrogenase-like predicted oxidoreductase